MATGNDHVPELLDAIELIDSALTLAQNSLLDSPTKEQERALNRIILRLNSERAVLVAEFDAALDQDTGVQGPSSAQVMEIADLSNRVEQATSNAVAVSTAITLTGKVLDLLTKVVSNK